MIFVVVDCELQECPEGSIKVFNSSSSSVRVTSEGHLLEPGKCACLAPDDETSATAIARGRVFVLGVHSAVAGKKPKRRNNPPRTNSKRCCP